MRLALIIIAVMLFCTHIAKAQNDSAHHPPKINSGPGILAAAFVLEGAAGIYSYVAAKPSWYGDKIMGGIYVAASAGFLAIGIAEYMHNKGDRREQICGSILYAGISYGLSRLAVYNLAQAEGHSFRSRFNRNFIEFNATYLVPFALYGLSEICIGKRSSGENGKTSLYFTGTGFMIARNL